MKPLANGSVLVVDDEPSIRLTVGMLLRGEGLTVREAGSAAAAATLLEQEPFDLVITDLRLGDLEGGLEVLKAVKRKAPDTEVVFLTAFGSIASAVEAVKLGAFDYLSKPFEPDDLVLVVRNAMERRSLVREVERLRATLEEEMGLSRLVARGPAMKRVLDLVRRVAPSEATVLLQGESGTGKELVARMIHTRSARAGRPFVAIECGAMPESLLESELFGHARGAFTGAVQAKRGLFEEADGGTVLLDEVGELPQQLQVKLLRVLQEQTIRPVGTNAHVKIDIRVIAATNRDLAAQVKVRAFREDLFYRLNGIVVELPPLRDRTEDVIPLAVYFIRTFADRLGKHVSSISPGAVEVLLQHPWPGNVRELEKAMERAVVLAGGEEIVAEDLPPTLQGKPEPGAGGSRRRTLADVEKAHILATLHEHGWNQARAAEELGISRSTLWRKLREYGIHPDV
ncbi:MAG TPA: sigma-54 dependent transcriptional regulator [Anaeromyxobacter sp.]